MENEGRQMPEHIKLAYEDAVKNVMFFKRQQWVATNYAVLVYAALFVISVSVREHIESCESFVIQEW